jgi:hypothetical protein
MMISWWSKHVGMILSVLMFDIWINVLLQTSALIGPLHIVNWNARWNNEKRDYCFKKTYLIIKIIVCTCYLLQRDRNVSYTPLHTSFLDLQTPPPPPPPSEVIWWECFKQLRPLLPTLHVISSGSSGSFLPFHKKFVVLCCSVFYQTRCGKLAKFKGNMYLRTTSTWRSVVRHATWITSGGNNYTFSLKNNSESHVERIRYLMSYYAV